MSLLKDLMSRDLKVLIFGGKGGSGKTTCAASIGIYAAAHGRKTLVFSVDPAHSLSDSFNQIIGNKITEVNGVDNLYGIEIDAQQLLEDFMNQYEKAMSEAAGQVIRSMPFDSEIIRDIRNLSPPGFDELMALSKLIDILKAEEYDLIVVDTAAGVHAIRLMELPHILEEWIGKVLAILERLGEVMSLEKFKILMENLLQKTAELNRLFTDPTRTLFVIVTIPEAMGIYVAEDMVRDLVSCRIKCKSIVINYFIPEGRTCDYCTLRRNNQIERVKEINNKFPEHEKVSTPFFEPQIRGKELLLKFAESLLEGNVSISAHAIRCPTRIKLPEIMEESRLDLLSKNLKLILFGGKGGCGKTTCSTATGIYLAKKGKKTLLISTDPQRSLSDSLDLVIGTTITKVECVENLYALEIDSQKMLEDFREEHGETILDIISAATYLDKNDLADFLSLSLPGIDEVMALMKVTSLIESGEYDMLILDTAPTGHTLRLLQLPDKMSDWIRLLITMRAKTQYIVRSFFGKRLREKADIFLEKTMQDIKRIRKILRDQKTEFVIVTKLDEMALAESERLLQNLRSHQIQVSQIVCNGLVIANPDCSYCTSEKMKQEKRLIQFSQKLPELKIIKMPLFPYEIRGIDKLTTFARRLYWS